MSLNEPFNYQDAAAEILDEIEIRGHSMAGVLELLEHAVVGAALEKMRGNKARAARLLRMNRTTLQMRISRISPAKDGE